MFNHALTDIKPLFLSGLQHYVKIPEELQDVIPSTTGANINDVMDEAHPWALAKRMVLGLLTDASYETQTLALLESLHTMLTQKTFLQNAVGIADDIFQLVSRILADPQFLNAFSKENALVTLYFLIIFLMSCARVEIKQVLEHEDTIVRIALFANRLLLNRQVYQFSRGATRCMVRKCKACVLACKK